MGEEKIGEVQRKLQQIAPASYAMGVCTSVTMDLLSIGNNIGSTVVLIHEYLGGVCGTIILRNNLLLVDISHIYCTVWTPLLGEARLQITCKYIYRSTSYNKLLLVDISHTYCTVWTPLLGEARLQITCVSSNLNWSEWNCFIFMLWSK